MAHFSIVPLPSPSRTFVCFQPVFVVFEVQIDASSIKGPITWLQVSLTDISIRDLTFMSPERSQQANLSWLPWASWRSNYQKPGRWRYTEVSWLDGRIGDLDIHPLSGASKGEKRGGGQFRIWGQWGRGMVSPISSQTFQLISLQLYDHLLTSRFLSLSYFHHFHLASLK